MGQIKTRDKKSDKVGKRDKSLRPEGTELRKAVINACKGIDNGPRVLKLYMEMCARCGTCAEQCPVYKGDPTRLRNPAARSDANCLGKSRVRGTSMAICRNSSTPFMNAPDAVVARHFVPWGLTTR